MSFGSCLGFFFSRPTGYPCSLVTPFVLTGDLDDVLAVVGDDRVTQWLVFDSRGRAEAEAMLAGIIDACPAGAQDRVLPRCHAARRRGPSGRVRRLGLDGVKAAKLGYAIRPECQGRGCATDAARALISFGFELGLHRVSAAIGPDNAASLAMMATLGCT